MRLLFSSLLIVAGFLSQSFSEANAQGFAALVSPPHFEGQVEAGKTYRNVIDFYNIDGKPGEFKVRTNDWVFDSKNLKVEFSDALVEKSCRSWVYLEASDIKIGPKSKKRYRFEVRVPDNTPAQECRFAIMFSGDDVARDLPVAGQLAVVVYLRVGDAKPNLSLVTSGSAVFDGKKLPTLTVKNEGNASTRLEGYIDGVDGNGNKVSFLPSSYPVLPGRTDALALNPQAENDKSDVPTIVYPVRIKGTLVWDNNKINVDETIK